MFIFSGKSDNGFQMLIIIYAMHIIIS